MTDNLRAMLEETVLQLEYLNEKEQRGTTNAVITRARAALAAAPQPAPETMAWAVVDSDGQIIRVSRDGRELAEKLVRPCEHVAPIAIRVVEGGDDTA